MPAHSTRKASGNTARLSLQEQGMPSASLTTIAPLQLREREPRPRAAIRDHGAATGIRSCDHAAFQAFVDQNRHLFVDYIQRRLNGPHSSAAEDALQEGLIKIWNEWAEWPTDEGERIRFARQSLRIAALEAIRRRVGRDGSPRAGEIVVDFDDLDGPAASAPSAEALARDLGRAIAEQSLVKDQFDYLEKASLVAAIATLTDLEQRALFMTARGDDCKEIAADLGVSHQQAREALMRARRLCRMLIEHADGQKVSAKEAKLLWQYRDGQLSGKRARELKRHIDHCTACQRLLGLEESIGTNGALVVLPIPVLLLAAGKTIGAGAAGTATGTTGGSGGSVGTALGGTVLAPAAKAGWAGSVVGGVTAKAGLALGALATAGSLAGVYKLSHDRQAERRAAAIAAIHPAANVSEPHDAIFVPATAATRTAPRKPASRATEPRRTAKRPRRAARTTTPIRPSAASAPATTATRPNVPVTVRQPRPAAPRRNSSSTSGSGGEFVLGSR